MNVVSPHEKVPPEGVFLFLPGEVRGLGVRFDEALDVEDA
jgi:hypothetical protein